MNASKYQGLLGVLAGVLSALFWVLSIPPFEFAEAAYIAFVPLLLWLIGRPRWRSVVLVGFFSGWLAWFSILSWLRHVTWLGTIGLSAILALLFLLWLLLARRLLPVLSRQGFVLRLIGFTGLGGAWVLIEWSRNWLLYGFPWAPLSLSQWERPVVLQVAAWTGAYGVSFLLVYFNCAVTQTLWHRVTAEKRKLWSGWFSPDLYMALAGLGLCIYLFFDSLPSPDSGRRLFSAGVVQPYIPAELKWDEAREVENLGILERQTIFVSHLEADLILWPEAATPWPVIGDTAMMDRVRELVDRIDQPILMGNLASIQSSNLWFNGACLIEPQKGLSGEMYRKRELVPFGEYVPAPFKGIVEKFVPLEGSFEPGKDAGVINFLVGDEAFKIGPLVCYEDVFPALARESVRAGAEVLFVTTNNAWYGEEGGAYQHAAHSVLRAVENRRPVMRCGNGGWSGWIDAYGTIRKVLRDEKGTVYFRGGGVLELFQYDDWSRRQSFYTRKGDWFVGVCGVFFLLSLLPSVFRPKKTG